MGIKIKWESTTKKQKKKIKGNFSKRLIIFCIAMAMLYTVFGLYMQWKMNIAPDATLTTGVFAAIFGELWELSKIKRKKLDSNGNGDDTNEI